MTASLKESLHQTPLYFEHVQLNARMVPFAGWHMPLQYESILAEYHSTRKEATLFDTSHMGEFLIEGDIKGSGLDRIVTCRLQDMPLKTCRYGTMLNEHGGIIDDLTVYRLEPNQWFLVVNAADIPMKVDHFKNHLTKDAAFEDISQKTGKLDIQGPLARDILSPLAPGIEELEYFAGDHFDLLGENVLISRTGYTGELGYEIYFPWERTKDLWQEILKNGKVKPAGLGARDLLRLEVGYSLYGQDLSEATNPLEAGLGRFVDFEKDFVGQESLKIQKEKGLHRKMTCLISEDRRSPRAHHKVYSEDAQEIGEITSGVFSPSLGRGIGMGYVEKGYAVKGQRIFFGNEKNRMSAEITTRPFYKGGSLKN